MPWASYGFGPPWPVPRAGADGPVGRPGVGRVHAAVLFSLSFRRLPVANVILSLEALPLGSAGRPPPASSRSASPLVLHEAALARGSGGRFHRGSPGWGATTDGGRDGGLFTA